jgi:hypothetical protein
MRAPLATAIAIAIGLIVLLGYFLPLPALQQIRALLLGWGVILAGVATLVGILNLLRVHWQKMQTAQGANPYSVILLLAFLLTFFAGLWLTPASPLFQNAVLAVILPVEISLLAIVAISLAYAGLRLLQQRRGMMVFVFLFSSLFFLFILSGAGTGLQNTPLVGGLFAFVGRLPLAGARGILLGIALGTLTTGLRILMGADRPYSG